MQSRRLRYRVGALHLDTSQPTCALQRSARERGVLIDLPSACHWKIIERMMRDHVIRSGHQHIRLAFEENGDFKR
jgi:hypothetical protein